MAEIEFANITYDIHGEDVELIEDLLYRLEQVKRSGMADNVLFPRKDLNAIIDNLLGWLDMLITFKTIWDKYDRTNTEAGSALLTDQMRIVREIVEELEKVR